MRGKILGFTPAAGSGAITGENGVRFTFAADQWRGGQPITVGASVDFAPVEGAATEIYPVASAMPAAADLMAGPTAQKLRTLSMTTLAFPLAVLLLLATLVPVISTPSQAPVENPSIWTLGNFSSLMGAQFGSVAVSYAASQLKELQQQALQLRTQTTGMYGAPVDNSQELMSVNQSIATAQKKLSDAQTLDTMTSALVIRWTVPVLALILLWFCWAGKDIKTITLSTGAAAIVTAIILYVYLQVLVGAMSSGMIASQEELGAILSLGMGTYLIGILGVGLILGGLGLVKNPLAAKAA